MDLGDILKHFQDHCKYLLQWSDEEDGFLYEKEYQTLREVGSDICNSEGHERNTAALPYNRSKNRYKDIGPFDYNRVQLTEKDGDPGSSYINASFITGVNGENAYIAAQGPTPKTVNDFWRMIWEKECKVIIMACNEMEGQKAKCHRYWPDSNDKMATFGDILVTLVDLDSRDDGDFLVRRLYVEQGGVVRTVMQYHYTAWPDHGIPRSITPILDLISSVRAFQKRDCPPIVIHCSAGCGRTGTVLAVDYTWNLLKKEMVKEKLNILDILTDMRKQRMALVQTAEQYEVVLRCVLEVFEKHIDLLDRNHYGNIKVDRSSLKSRPLVPKEKPTSLKPARGSQPPAKPPLPLSKPPSSPKRQPSKSMRDQSEIATMLMDAPITPKNDKVRPMMPVKAEVVTQPTPSVTHTIINEGNRSKIIITSSSSPPNTKRQRQPAHSYENFAIKKAHSLEGIQSEEPGSGSSMGRKAMVPIKQQSCDLGTTGKHVPKMIKAGNSRPVQRGGSLHRTKNSYSNVDGSGWKAGTSNIKQQLKLETRSVSEESGIVGMQPQSDVHYSLAGDDAKTYPLRSGQAGTAKTNSRISDLAAKIEKTLPSTKQEGNLGGYATSVNNASFETGQEIISAVTTSSDNSSSRGDYSYSELEVRNSASNDSSYSYADPGDCDRWRFQRVARGYEGSGYEDSGATPYTPQSDVQEPEDPQYSVVEPPTVPRKTPAAFLDYTGEEGHYEQVSLHATTNGGTVVKAAEDQRTPAPLALKDRIKLLKGRNNTPSTTSPIVKDYPPTYTQCGESKFYKGENISFPYRPKKLNGPKSTPQSFK